MPQKIWAVGEEVLAADFNNYVQNQTVPSFTTAAQRDSQWTAPPNGALCVTTDTNTVWQRIAGVWQYAPGARSTTTFARAHVSVNSTIAAGGLIPFNVATRDPLAMYSVANKNFTVPAAGHYLVVGCIDFTTNTTSNWVTLTIRKNGANVALAGGGFHAMSAWDMPIAFHEIVVCNASDTIDVLYGGSVVTVSGAADSSKSYCSLQYLHA